MTCIINYLFRSALIVNVTKKNFIVKSQLMITVDEDLTKYLHSLLQVEMTGSSIFDYIHQGDHVEIAEQLGLSLSSQSQPSSGMTSPSSNDEPTGTHNPHGEF